MRKGIHPDYQEVVFMDSATGATVCLQRTNNSWFLPKEQPTLDCSFFMLNVV